MDHRILLPVGTSSYTRRNESSARPLRKPQNSHLLRMSMNVPRLLTATRSRTKVPILIRTVFGYIYLPAYVCVRILDTVFVSTDVDLS